MIVTVKAWLHADLDIGSDDFKGTVFRLNSFSTPLTDNSVVIREMSFDLIVEDGFDREKIAAERKSESIRKQLEMAKRHVVDLETLLKGAEQ